jgi:hypothetical protein
MTTVLNFAKDEILEFSTNWNKKLHADYFTTIRIPNPNKYYPGKVLKIIIKGTYSFNAQVMEIKTIMAQELPPWTCYLDTGYNKQETLNILYKMYSGKYDLNKKPLALILLKNIDN